ncbi:hypothetical protein XA68_15687 [Ophiocordyceps unilateralis]|uniref:FAD-binding domain-containing protein n=1 Tax=Ophiocordyceps unilateralis TaxID=268505 RepID=A0A2A9P7Q2_OPHUN|nr:hypothetical protein XA68_15687 [Ophiocordyceps unilateralis]
MEKVVIVGAGPVGCLAAYYAARRGCQVDVYELRSDLRSRQSAPPASTQSINLTLSERGINAIKLAGHATLLSEIMDDTVPIIGRMVHGRNSDGSLYEHAQKYDVKGRATHAVDRFSLNSHLLDAINSMPNVKLFFNHRLTSSNLHTHYAYFEVRDATSKLGHCHQAIEVTFDLLIGADGSHSVVRQHLMKVCPIDYHQEYLDMVWFAFHLTPHLVDRQDGRWAQYRISQNHLHIWPSKDLMFIAIANKDGSFTCTLFLSRQQSADLESNPSDLPAFFDKHFPGVTDLISGEKIISSFIKNSRLPIFSQKCRPAIYGQGVNAGMEDVRILYSILDKHAHTGHDAFTETQPEPPRSRFMLPFQRARALAEYSAMREADAHAIHSLALENYAELRSSLSKRYRVRKFVEECITDYFPSSGWRTKFAGVCFSNDGHSAVLDQNQRQGRLLITGFLVFFTYFFAVAAGVIGYCNWL